MSPRKFYIGFPPALVKTTRKGIEYGIGTIPLGGYVKIPGMHRPAAGDVDDLFGPVLSELPGLSRHLEAVKRALVAEDYAAATEALAEVRTLLAGVVLSAAAAKAAERALAEVGDACAPDAYWRARTWRRVVVILAGPGANFIAAGVLFFVVFLVSLGPATNLIQRVDSTVTVGSKQQRSPAAVAGLRAGDRVLSINGKPTPDGDTLRTAITGSHGKPLALTVQRLGARVSLPPVKPILLSGAYRLGIGLDDSGHPAGVAAWKAVKALGFVSRDTGKSLGNLIHQQGRDQVSSPVGIVRESARAASAGWEQYVTLLAFISLSLGLLNLLPLLPLDGGHIAVSLIEGVRGRAFHKEAYMRISMVGIALVLMLFFIGLTNDVGGRGG
jgi:regulator of sigma E protease